MEREYIDVVVKYTQIAIFVNPSTNSNLHKLNHDVHKKLWFMKTVNFTPTLSETDERKRETN